MSTDMGGRNLEASHEKTPAAQQCSTKNTKLARWPPNVGQTQRLRLPRFPENPRQPL
ncbi:hypothetical protein CPAR01_12342 [Colletotrichum paranaense]|uniref:Uncharacterized protein n=1 Tax=Colletotrichum paranaense TaxID=1914294 RepID=A0ABQ9S7D7_9PEZI|nr:uncharacterized protein CPAR01_12342 [Colletotrichum paranaense]KAK1527784.1 hypothetical protein CPAR01_12342 [Colletotrichum paranaense]